MAWDASRQNEKRSSRIYRDLNLNFTANPVTGDVTTVTDVQLKGLFVIYYLQTITTNHSIQRLDQIYHIYFLKTLGL